MPLQYFSQGQSQLFGYIHTTVCTAALFLHRVPPHCAGFSDGLVIDTSIGKTQGVCASCVTPATPNCRRASMHAMHVVCFSGASEGWSVRGCDC